MELRTLRYFLTVVSEGNMTKAADILHVTQPTLNRQMMDLEEELGGKILARYMKEFRERYLGVQFDLHNEMADSIKEKMDKGLLDMRLLLEPMDTVKYEFMRLSQKETCGIFMRKDHPLAGKEYLTVQDIKAYPLMMPSRPVARRELLNWMRCDESELIIPVNYNLLSNVALLVEAGMGSAVCLDGALSVHYSCDTCFKPVFPEHTSQRVAVEKESTPAPGCISVYPDDSCARRTMRTGAALHLWKN